MWDQTRRNQSNLCDAVLHERVIHFPLVHARSLWLIKQTFHGTLEIWAPLSCSAAGILWLFFVYRVEHNFHVAACQPHQNQLFPENPHTYASSQKLISHQLKAATTVCAFRCFRPLQSACSLGDVIQWGQCKPSMSTTMTVVFIYLFVFYKIACEMLDIRKIHCKWQWDYRNKTSWKNRVHYREG